MTSTQAKTCVLTPKPKLRKALAMVTTTRPRWCPLGRPCSTSHTPGTGTGVTGVRVAEAGGCSSVDSFCSAWLAGSVGISGLRTSIFLLAAALAGTVALWPLEATLCSGTPMPSPPALTVLVTEPGSSVRSRTALTFENSRLLASAASESDGTRGTGSTRARRKMRRILRELPTYCKAAQRLRGGGEYNIEGCGDGDGSGGSVHSIGQSDSVGRDKGVKASL
jgi:hypothetical protein